jgi:hypothetical protein
MLVEENDNRVDALPFARQKRKTQLAEKQAREGHGLEHLERIAAFIEGAMTEFMSETSGKPVVHVTLSSPQVPLNIVLRVNDNGEVIHISDEQLPF